MIWGSMRVDKIGSRDRKEMRHEFSETDSEFLDQK